MNSSRIGDYSRIIVAIIIVAGMIAASFYVTSGFVKIKSGSNVITVTGSAKKQITSDLVVWTGTFSAKSQDLKTAYSLLEGNKNSVQTYLDKQGLTDTIVYSSINTNVHYVMGQYGQQTSEIEAYELSQDVTISSANIDKITEISRNITELINEGVQFQSQPPQYMYTKIADLKIEMLAAATKDATTRAQMIAENAGSKLGKLKTESMGVFQITQKYSNDVTDSGISDTSSLDKEITAVVNCQFYVN